MMQRDRRSPDVSGEAPEPDDIEILEIVGLEEDTAGAADADEVEVSFEEGADVETAERTSEQERPLPPIAREDPAGRERLLRLQADFENLKKRIDREKEDHYRHATASLIARLLPVIDNFDRAMGATKPAKIDEAFRDGLALIHKQLVDELHKEGLRPIEVVGKPFDPAVHEAVATVVSSTLPANTVVEEARRGYFFRDRLLRPALVRVSLDASGDAGAAGGREES